MARWWTTNPMAREVSSSIRMTSEVGKYLRAHGSMVAGMVRARWLGPQGRFMKVCIVWCWIYFSKPCFDIQAVGRTTSNKAKASTVLPVVTTTLPCGTRVWDTVLPRISTPTVTRRRPRTWRATRRGSPRSTTPVARWRRETMQRYYNNVMLQYCYMLQDKIVFVAI